MSKEDDKDREKAQPAWQWENGHYGVPPYGCPPHPESGHPHGDAPGHGHGQAYAHPHGPGLHPGHHHGHPGHYPGYYPDHHPGNYGPYGYHGPYGPYPGAAYGSGLPYSSAHAPAGYPPHPPYPYPSPQPGSGPAAGPGDPGQGAGAGYGHGYGYGPGAGASTGLQGWLQGLLGAPHSQPFLMGLAVGAGAAWVLSDEETRERLMRAGVSLYSNLTGGAEELKEQIADIQAELDAERHKNQS
ncbi:YtxH domain-containing protein [Halorhodospira abdelmalekii]|uniref:YtxH domain-containing protein n=1 Tax=Halorhodospira abdelmalekii TaxID=421629 RepID=UPI0019036501|nr:YtxH domain-containing protein [Halorhodospira abdelmalekii]